MLIDSNDLKDAIIEILKNIKSLEYRNKRICDDKIDANTYQLEVLSEEIALLKILEKLNIS